MRDADGAWIGWSGAPAERPEPFDADGMHLVPVALSARRGRGLLRGLLQRARCGRSTTTSSRRRSSTAAGGRPTSGSTSASPTPPPSRRRTAPTVWVHDYQLQLVPAMLRELRPDLRIGFFIHIPFPGYEIFAQLPWRRQIVRRPARRRPARLPAPAATPPTSCAPAGAAAGLRPRRGAVGHRSGTEAAAAAATRQRAGGPRSRSRSTPTASSELARRPTTSRPGPRRSGRRWATREVVLLGVDRLDYTKGILHRLQAYGELLAERRLGPPDAVLVQVASPSRERVEQYQLLRDEVEVRSAGSTASTASSATRPCTTCTSPTRGRSWPRCTWPRT